MRLSEIMSNMDLSFYPQIALVIFLGVFIGVLVQVFSKKKTKEYEEAARLPLED
ncbi:MAG: cbb3-type cytochrome c oxidase subunit 3 [Myxococcales bacterium]|nr:cbb3-type cytochrome c oxidase subunit 3 [Myxococcales bacterium]